MVYMTIGVSIVYWLVILATPQLSENALVFFISGFALYVVPFKVDWFFCGLQQFGYIAARSVIVKLLSVVLLFALVHDKNDIVLYVSISAFSIIANEIWNFFKLVKMGVTVKLVMKGCTKHLKPIFILFSSFIATAIYTSFGTIILGIVSNYSDVAYYNCASNICKIMVPIVTSMASVALPQVANYIKNKKESECRSLINKSISLTLFLSLPITAMLFLVAPDFVPLFFGGKFVDSIIPMKVLSCLVIFVGLNNITGIQILIGMGKDKEFLKSVSFSAMFSILIYLVFIPLWGAIGAAIGTVIAEFLILLISYIYIKRTTSIVFNVNNDFIKTVISTVLMIAIYVILKECLSGWSYIILGSIIGAIVYMLAQYLLGNNMLYIINKMFLKRFTK